MTPAFDGWGEGLKTSAPVVFTGKPLHNRAMPRTLQFYYDVVCPYAYLASLRVEELAARAGVELSWHPILLGGLFRNIGQDPDPNRKMNPNKARLNLLDMHRWADYYGFELEMPAQHPRRSVSAMRLLVGTPVQRRPALSHALYRAYWVEGRDIADREVLAQIAGNHGVDAAVIDSQQARDGLFASTQEAADLGAFGVPTFVLDGHMWWGQDRMHLVAQALGLREADGLPHAPQDRSGMAKTPAAPGTKVTFFHDFSSPFSYLAQTQLDRVVQACGAEVEYVPILLGALFRQLDTPDVPLLAMPPNRRTYIGRDLHDWAAHWGVDFRFPDHFPLRTVLPLRVAVAEPRTTAAVYRAAWADNQAIDNPEVLASVLQAAGFDAQKLLAAAQTQPVKDALRENTERARVAGACGVPTYVVHRPGKPDEVLWGQDRLELLAAFLQGRDLGGL